MDVHNCLYLWQRCISEVKCSVGALNHKKCNYFKYEYLQEGMLLGNESGLHQGQFENRYF